MYSENAQHRYNNYIINSTFKTFSLSSTFGPLFAETINYCFNSHVLSFCF